MSDPEKINEEAIRAQMDAALDKMQATDPVPEPESSRSSSSRSRGGGGDPHLHTGTITTIQGNEVYVELGPRSQGVISIDEFDEPPEIGKEFEFSLVSIQDGLWTLSRREARTLATWRDLEKGRTVKANVIGENSGGLELKIGPVSAFMPASEIAVGRVEEFAPLIGQMMVCEVMEVSRRRKRVVLSRRAVLMRERRESRARTLESIAVGQVLKGKVEKIESFGAFVDLNGGVTGLLHVSNIAHKRIEDPSTVLTVGQDVEVQVLEIKEGGKRIGLGMKQLAADPWDGVEKSFRVGTLTKGKVVRVTDFGAFVELEGGVEGLLHLSQLSPDRINRVEDVVSVGMEVTVRVQAVDRAKKRISLSRLTERGNLIGSEEDLGSEDLDRYLEKGSSGGSGTNLGDVLRAAMEKRNKGG